MHQALLMFAANLRQTMLAAMFCCLGIGCALSSWQSVHADELGAASPSGQRLTEDPDAGFTTVSDANTPARLPSPPPSPFGSAPTRPLTCCHPNVPHPGQQVHPTLAALAEAVRPGRRQAMASPAHSPIEPTAAQQEPARLTSGVAELPAASHADEPLAMPRSTSEARLPETSESKHEALPHARPVERERRPRAALPAETHPLRSMNGPATVPEHPSTSEAQPLRPSTPREFRRPLPPRGFAAPQTAPLESHAPKELPHDVEPKVIQPAEDVEVEAPASKTAKLDSIEAKVINNPWAKREEQAAAKHSSQGAAAEPVRLVRYGNAEARLPAALPPTAAPGNMTAAPSHKPAQAPITAAPDRAASVYDRQPASTYAPQARYATSPSPAAEQALVARSAPAQRPASAVEWQTSADESEPNPLRGRLPRAAYPSGHWAAGNPLR
jgi:hypothetical protein